MFLRNPWQRFLRTLFFIVFLSHSFLVGFGLSLKEYISSSGRPSYDIVSNYTTPVGGKVFILNLTSQVWRGIEWRHKVLAYIPRRLAFREHGVLIINGSAPRDLTNIVNQYVSIAEMIGAPVVSLWDVPNQPIFGLREDALIAYTFHQFVQTGEPDWPLLLPMTKSAVSAIDVAVDLFGKNGLSVTKFLVTGGSKRGWTSYLTGAVDERVCGIAPIVYDNLNMPEQMRRQLEYYGTFSEQLRDYSKYSFTQAAANISNGRLETLLKMVDPYFYEINVPIMILIGTNDPYWVVDSSEVYFGHLREPKYIRAFPNEGHDIRNVQDALITLRSFLYFCAYSTFPKLEWSLSGKEYVVETDEEIEWARGWYAVSETLDFRRAAWNYIDLAVGVNDVSGASDSETRKSIVRFDFSELLPANGNLVVMVEVRLVKEGIVTVLTTTPKVLRGGRAGK